VISPYAKQGYISHQLSEFSSLVKFVESNFRLPSLGQRDSLSTISNLMDYFDFTQTPQSALILNPLPYSNTLEVPRGGAFGIKGTLNPPIGGTSTKYQYSITYTRTDTPPIHNVIIDGVAHPMTRIKTVSGTGTLYQYTTALAVGNHAYSFTFSNGTGTLTLPDNGVPFSGPQVHPFTLDAFTAPLTPSSVALPGQMVTYNVTYTSPANKPPTFAEVDIDGVPHSMHSSGPTNYTQGVHYIYTTNTLSQGVHYLVYRFDDGSGVAAYPGRIAPLITPIVLSKSSVAPTSGTTSTLFTFSTSYAEASGHPPGQASLYVENKAYSMSYISGSYSTGALFQVQMRLPAGKHSFFFIFSDSQSKWADPFAPQAYAGPTVGANAQPIAPGTLLNSPAELD
jgi:hypothetical protein